MSAIRKMPHRLPTGLCDEDIFSTEVQSSQMILVYLKGDKKLTYETVDYSMQRIQFKGKSKWSWYHEASKRIQESLTKDLRKNRKLPEDFKIIACKEK